MTSEIPVSKSVVKNNLVPDNGFAGFTGLGSSSAEIDYSKIPQLTTKGQWLMIVPFRNQPKKKAGTKIIMADSAKNKVESYLVVGSNPDVKGVKIGDVIKIMGSAKHRIEVEVALVDTFCGLDVFAVAPEAIFWIVPDEHITKLVF